jgi:hypothetical protein
VRGDEPGLLIGRELHHAVKIVGVERRKDAAGDAEIWMPHVGALDRVLHPEGDATEESGHAKCPIPR